MASTTLTIEVEVAQLLSTLKTNRAKHLKDYEAAKAGYLKLLKRELETKLRVVDGQPRSKVRAYSVNGQSEASLSRIVNQKPENYLAYYDEVIGMLEWTQDDVIRLDSTQYQQYIKNEWNWSNNFTTSNVAYAAAARR